MKKSSFTNTAGCSRGVYHPLIEAGRWQKNPGMLKVSSDFLVFWVIVRNKQDLGMILK